MIKKSLFQLTKLSLFGIIFLIVGVAAMPAQAQNNPWGITDTDTLWLRAPGGNFIINYPIFGDLFNAINHRYIVNKNGFTTEIGQDGQERRWFGLIAFNHAPNLDDFMVNALTAARSFNFAINDRFMIHYARVMVSILMPQAIEKVEFVPTPENITDLVRNHVSSEPHEIQKGIVRFYTRPTPCTISNKNTLYLLNGVEITSAIFEAIHPIFIRSLQRITDSDKLSSFNQSRLQEVVKIETFSYFEIRPPMPFTGNSVDSIYW